MAIISRRQYDHPALATAGGSALHAAIENLYTVLGNDAMSRYKAFTAVANSSVGVIAHEFGLDFANLKVQIFTGTYPALTLVSDPIGTGWTVAATTGLASRSIDVTAPASGGPHTYAVVVTHESSGSQFIPGLVSIGTQSFAGAKTFLNTVTFPTPFTLGAVSVTATGAELNFSIGVTSLIQSQINLKAAIASPTFTGVPLSTTAAVDTNTTQIATTAYVIGQGYAKLASPMFTGVVTIPAGSLQASPNFTDFTLYGEVASPATPAAGKVAIFAKTDKKMYRKGSDGVEAEIGSGSASGFINYILNADLEAGNTTGWATYKDAAAATPVDGTGGSPTTLTVTANSTTPLRGAFDLKIAKTAANSQGEGFSYAFSIKSPDISKKLQVSFDLNTNDANYVSGDVVIYLYDVTNSVLITPSSTSIPKVGASTYSLTFDTTTSLSYRLIFHWATTNATASNIFLENFFVGPGIITQGAAISEWQSYTPTGTWTTNATYTGYYRRIGSSAEFTVKIALAGAPTGGTLTAINLPSGLTINSSALPIPTASDLFFVGQANFTDSGVAYTGVVTVVNGTTNSVRPYWSDDTAVGVQIFSTTASGPFIWGSADYMTLNFTVPIAEWAGNGTVNLGAGAQVEYAYNSSTNNTTADTTSFAAGPQGALIGSITAAINRRVQFSYPIQSDDKISLEVSDDRIVWFETPLSFINNQSVTPYITENSTTYGMGLDHVSTTQVDVYFGQYAGMFGKTTVGGAGQAWSVAAGAAYWRVRKAKSSAPVGFGLAGTDGSSGLYKAGSAPGLTTGAAVAAGYVGEVLQGTGTNVAITNSATYYDVASKLLTKGTWLVSSIVTHNEVTALTAVRFITGISSSSGNAFADFSASLGNLTDDITMPTANGSITYSIPNYIVNLSVDTTYYLKAWINRSAGSSNATGRITAVRIA